GTGVGDVLAQVPAVGVDDLLLAGEGVVDGASLVAGAPQRAAGAAAVIQRATVVVAHLHQDEVARPRGGEDLVPAALGLERAAAAGGAPGQCGGDARRGAPVAAVGQQVLGLGEQAADRPVGAALPGRLHGQVADGVAVAAGGVPGVVARVPGLGRDAAQGDEHL